MANFSDFKLSKSLQNILSSMSYITATEVQAKAIPLIMDGKDILASSQTGTGKTGAFLIPIITMLEQDKDKYALIVTPTRELAKQIKDVANDMLYGNKKIKTALLIGGENILRQIRQLKQHPRIIIGTPGRINDHLIRKTLKLEKTHFLVLDETDRMLDMGFGVQIDDIIKFMPEKKQSVLFSATLPKAIIKLSQKYLINPERIAIGSHNSVTDNITQQKIETKNKLETLVGELNKIEGSILIFVRTQRTADRLKVKLKEQSHKTDVLHGGLRQNVRARIMKKFRDKKCRILVATDVASRGLDVPHIEYVINYDLPDNPEDYVHRIGRTARAKKTGIAVNLVSKADNIKWSNIQKFLKGDEDGIVKEKRGGRRRGSSKRKGSVVGRDNSRGRRRRGSRSEEAKKDGKKIFNREKGSAENKPFGNRKKNNGGERSQNSENRKRERCSDKKGHSGDFRSSNRNNIDKKSSFSNKRRNYGERGRDSRDSGNKSRRDNREVKSYDDRKPSRNRRFNSKRDSTDKKPSSKRKSYGNREYGNKAGGGDRRIREKVEGRRFGGKKKSFADTKEGFKDSRGGNRKFGSKKKSFGNKKSYGSKKSSGNTKFAKNGGNMRKKRKSRS